jgi:hypothetical protein
MIEQDGFLGGRFEMMLVVGVSRRMLPLLERYMRDADCVGGVPPGACVLVAQSEQDGGVGGTEGSDTGESLSRSCSGVRGACGHIAIEACKSGVHHRSVSESGRLFL